VPEHVLHTGAHIDSLRAIAGGTAHVACIDALSFRFIIESNPAIGGRVHVIGHGPRIPSLPLVMANALATRRDEVRAAFAAAVADPSLAATCATLRIRGFVPFELEDYAPVWALLPAG
jgi:ABC-type phosphate/phosphonate transport system substrate-binding protein